METTNNEIKKGEIIEDIERKRQEMIITMDHIDAWEKKPVANGQQEMLRKNRRHLSVLQTNIRNLETELENIKNVEIKQSKE